MYKGEGMRAGTLFRKILCIVLIFLTPRVAVGLLSSPDHISPLGYIPTTNPTFQWQSVFGATQYIFEIRDKDTEIIVHREDNVPTNSFVLPASVQLQYHQTYQWRVMAINSMDFSGWTLFRGFITYDPNFVPTAQDPFAFVPTVDPLFTWTAVTGADHYHVQVTDRDANQIVFDDNNVTGTSMRLPGSQLLEVHRTYIWNVSAVKASGEEGKFSLPRGFKTYDPAYVPLTLAPFSYVGGARPVFSWTAVPKALSYRIQIIDKDVEQVILEQGQLQSTTFSLPDGMTLRYGGRYWWKVLAVDENGLESVFSNPSGFIPFDVEFQPKALTPFSYIDQNNPEFIWEPSKGAVSYELELKKPATGEIVFAITGITSTSLVFPFALILEPGVSYHWKVRAYNALGEVSHWSDVRGFILRSADLMGFSSLQPIPLGPSGDVMDLNVVTFSWEALPEAVMYQVFIYDGTSKWPVFSITTDKVKLNIFDNEFNFTTGTTYYWRVRGVDATTQYSLASEQNSFVVSVTGSSGRGRPQKAQGASK